MRRLVIVLLFCFNLSNAQLTDVVIGLSNPAGIAFNNNDLYIAEGGGANKISKVDITDVSPTAIDVITGLSIPHGLALNGNDLYISEVTGNKISKIDITDASPTATDAITGLTNPVGLLLHGNDLYITEINGSKISKIDITDASPTAVDVVTGLSNPSALALNGDILYIAEQGGNKISKINITDASPIASTVITGLSSPSGLAFIGNELYIAEHTGNKISKIISTEISPTVTDVVTGLNSPVSVIYKDESLYIAEYAGKISKFTDASLALKTYVPDDDFEQALIDLGYDTVLDDYVITANIETVTSLNLVNIGISDLTGLEDFIALETFYCNGNGLDTLDIGANTLLKVLSCSNNQLTSLDLSNNLDLISLNYQYNQISSLDLSANTLLKHLTCDSNSITNLDISNNLNLESIACNNNQITNLDVSNNTKLFSLVCNNNSLTSIDVTNNINLTQFICSNNQLTTLDVSNNTILSNLSCANNFISTLDLSNNSAIKGLSCYSNLLTALDLTNNILLDDFRCYDNQITNLNLNNAPDLRVFYCQNNLIEGLNLDRNPNLAFFICSNNPISNLIINNGNNTSINIYQSLNTPNLSCIEVDDVAYSNANWTNKDAVSSFNSNCGMTYVPDDNFEQALIDLGYDTVLDDYVITANISSVTNLTVSNKNITYLTGIEDFSSLQNLNCNNNQIVHLDLSSNTSLRFLNCSDNDLSTFNFKNINYYNFVPTFTFSAFNNPNLMCIEVDDATWCHANLTRVDDQTSFGLNCHYTETYVPDDNFEQALIDLGYDTILDDYVTTSNINSRISLYLSYKNIEDLTGIEDFTALQTLDCSNNNITNLFLHHNKNLVYLDLRNSQLTLLNFNNTNNTAVTFFNTTGNPNLTCIKVDDSVYSTANWTTIDATSAFNEFCDNTDTYVPDDNFEQALIDLGYDSGSLNDYVLTENINSIRTLAVENKSIADLTGIEDFTALKTLRCSGNQLTSLDLSTNTALVDLNCHTNQLNGLDLSSNTLLTSVFCSSNFLTSLDFSSNPNLKFLQCQNSQLNTLNLSANTELLNVFCQYNQITDLDISLSPNITYFDCSNNQLTNLEVSNNSALISLRCNDNAIEALDLSNNPSLNTIALYNNSLSVLDLKNGNNSAISFMSALNNPNLTCVEVDDVTYSTTNWTNIDAINTFSEDCSIKFTGKVYLQGASVLPFSGEETLMRDNLRMTNLIPTTSPYSDMLTCDASVFNTTGTNAIVDWILIELRDKNDSTVILESRSALLQRDGDIVDIDGLSEINLNSWAGNYYISIKHRNHLGILTITASLLNFNSNSLDFTNGSITTFGNNAQTHIQMPSGIAGMWAGDLDANSIIAFSGGSSETDILKDTVLNHAGNIFGSITYFFEDYSSVDSDLNQVIKFQGANNDSNLIKDNIINHPENIFSSITWIINEQLP